MNAVRTRLRGRRLLGAVLSLLAIAGCAWWAAHQDAPRFPDSAAGLALIVAALGVYAVATVLRGWRWDVILRRAGVGHQRADAYGLTVVGYMGNTVLPARGGEVLRTLLLSQRSGARRREVIGAILPERLLDAAALMVLFAGLTAAGVADDPVGRAPAYVAAAGLVAGVVALFVYLRLRVAGHLQRFADMVRPVARASRLLLTPMGVWLAGVSLAVWLSEAGVFWLIARSLELEVSLPEASIVVVLGSLSALVPAAPGYVGTYDAALLFTLHALGIGGGSALGAVLLFRFVVFVPITVAGLVLMVVRYGGLWALGDADRGSPPPDGAASGAGEAEQARRAGGSRRG
jgi:uncharacterized membrane protein YbhN (UPF0104 family)